MKFQNPSLIFFFKGRTDTRTDARTSPNQYAPHFFKVGGIKILCKYRKFSFLVSIKSNYQFQFLFQNSPKIMKSNIKVHVPVCAVAKY